MSNYLEQLVITYTTPFYVLIILGEILLSNYTHTHRYTVKDTATNIYLSTLNAVIDLLFRSVYVVILTFFWQYRMVEIETAWLYWLLLFVGEDFMYYWLHYVDHYSRFFWASHVTHHSSETYNFTIGFRSSVFQPLYRFIYFIPLALLGFQPADMIVMYAVTQIYGILVHTQYVRKLGILEYFLITPSHHRVHHASNVEYLDKNMGMCLLIWDKMFGTFQAELDDVPVRFGLTKPLEHRDPFNIIFHEWKAILNDLQKPTSFKNKLKYVFAPPGWSHDGSSKTSEQLRNLPS